MTNSKLLNLRGIGKKYHTLGLTTYDHPTAKEALEWFQDKAETDLAIGKALNFCGHSQETYDAAILTARALILKGYSKLRCVSLQDAVDDEFIQLIYDQHPPFLIHNFNPDAVDQAAYHRLENCLNYYLDNLIPVFLHHSRPLDEYTLVGDTFKDRVTKTNRTLVGA